MTEIITPAQADLITRARKEWLEPYLVEFDAAGREIPIEYVPCPPEVVAALLDVLETDIQYRPPSGAMSAAEAAIAKALEGV